MNKAAARLVIRIILSLTGAIALALAILFPVAPLPLIFLCLPILALPADSMHGSADFISIKCFIQKQE